MRKQWLMTLPVAIILAAAAGCSFGGSGTEPGCGDHGTWNGSACDCDAGYATDPGDPESCIPAEQVCSGHGELDDGVCDCDDGFINDPADPADCIDPDTLECGGHGHVHDGQYCSCDDGWMQDPQDEFNCIPDPDYECSGHGELVDGACDCDPGYEQVPGDPTACQREGTQHSDGVAVDVTLLLHEDQVKISLHSLQVSGAADNEFDLYMAHDGPGPNLKLGPGVTGVDLGADRDYHAVEQAPADGYAADDDEAGEYVIGIGFIAGGEGSSGFDMTGNVYALRLSDGSYAKVEVLSARAGEVHLLCYHQPDGSRDLYTDTVEVQ